MKEETIDEQGAVAHPALTEFGRRSEGIIEVPFEQLSKIPQALELIRARVIDGLVVPALYAPEVMAEVTARFWRREPEVPFVAPFGEPPHVYCRPLVTTEDPDEYLGMVPVLRRLLADLFDGFAPFEPRFEAVLTTIAGGRRVQVPRAADGRMYSPATMRTLPIGNAFAPHFGRRFFFAPPGAHLRSMMRCDMTMSYFTPVALPSRGGELVLYPVEWEDAPDYKVNGIPIEFADLFAAKRVVPLAPGDLVIFDGSRILHAITPVAPGPLRVTLGGFLGFTAADDGVFYWS